MFFFLFQSVQCCGPPFLMMHGMPKKWTGGWLEGEEVAVLFMLKMAPSPPGCGTTLYPTDTPHICIVWPPNDLSPGLSGVLMIK